MLIRLIGLLVAFGLFIFLICQKKVLNWKKAILVIVSFLLVVFMIIQVFFPFIPAKKPTGPYGVITETAFYKYNTDIPGMATNGNEREIPVKVWFPKDAQAKSHPLFLFSPGSFGVAESNETLFLELASRGYVVVSMNHPYHSFSCKMSDGRNINMDGKFIQSVMNSQGSEDLPGTLSSFKEWLKVRIDDINTVLDCISDFQNDYDYERYIDKERTVLSGHSLGGSAVLAVGRERAQEIKALAVLEAPFAADIVGIDKDRYIFTDQPYPLPVLHVYSDALYGKMDEITTYDMNTRLMKSDNPMYVNKHIKGVGHLGLTDMRLVTPVITYLMDGGLDTRPAAETLSELNEYVLDFLNIYNN